MFWLSSSLFYADPCFWWLVAEINKAFSNIKMEIKKWFRWLTRITKTSVHFTSSAKIETNCGMSGFITIVHDNHTMNDPDFYFLSIELQYQVLKNATNHCKDRQVLIYLLWTCQNYRLQILNHFKTLKASVPKCSSSKTEFFSNKLFNQRENNSHSSAINQLP